MKQLFPHICFGKEAAMQTMPKAFLEKTPFFGALPDETFSKLEGMLKQRQFKEGQTIFFEGDRGASMFIIVSGEVLMVRRSAAAESNVRLVRLHPGDFFGETTLIEMQPRQSTAQAETDVQLLELTSMDLYKLYKTDVKGYVLILQNINRELCRRLRAANSRVTDLAAVADDTDKTQIAYVKPIVSK